MRSKCTWALISLVVMIAIVFVPEAPLFFVKRALEVMAIVDLGMKVLEKSQQD